MSFLVFIGYPGVIIHICMLSSKSCSNKRNVYLTYILSMFVGDIQNELMMLTDTKEACQLSYKYGTVLFIQT